MFYTVIIYMSASSITCSETNSISSPSVITEVYTMPGAKQTLNKYFLDKIILEFDISMWKWKSLSPVQLFVTPWTWNSPGQNTGVGTCSLLQGIFPTQGSNPGPQHCSWILYQLSHQGSFYSNMHFKKYYSFVFQSLGASNI